MKALLIDEFYDELESGRVYCVNKEYHVVEYGNGFKLEINSCGCSIQPQVVDIPDFLSEIWEQIAQQKQEEVVLYRCDYHDDEWICEKLGIVCSKCGGDSVCTCEQCADSECSCTRFSDAGCSKERCVCQPYKNCRSS